jgi:hypothetical protein
MVIALAVGVPSVIAGVVWLLKPEWRGKRLFIRWLVTVIAITLVFDCVELLVHPVTHR